MGTRIIPMSTSATIYKFAEYPSHEDMSEDNKVNLFKEHTMNLMYVMPFRLKSGISSVCTDERKPL